MDSKDYNVEYFKRMLEKDMAWVERGIVRIYEFQTESEKVNRITTEENGIGFNKPDSTKMTKYARWILAGNHLTGEFKEDAKKRIVKYAGQLLKLALEKK